MAAFKAIVVDKAEGGQTVRLTDFDEKDLMDGDVTVASNSRHSTTRTGSRLPASRRWCGASR